MLGPLAWSTIVGEHKVMLDVGADVVEVLAREQVHIE